jgi:hypothetical protein
MLQVTHLDYIYSPLVIRISLSLSANGWMMKVSSKVQLLTNSILKENASNIFLVPLDLKYNSYPDTL